LVKKQQSPTPDQLHKISQFYTAHQKEDDYSIIFNFFYGDQAAQSLGYPTYGVDGINGFEYAHLLAAG
jgi:hypothetical protein